MPTPWSTRRGHLSGKLTGLSDFEDPQSPKIRVNRLGGSRERLPALRMDRAGRFAMSLPCPGIYALHYDDSSSRSDAGCGLDRL